MAGDVESNPGPRSKDRCNICKKICTLKQKAIQCDTCDEWYHASCLHMNTPVYYALGNKDASWHCVPCGLPQFTSGLFDSFDADTSNPYNILNTIPNQTHQPLARSTPVKPKSTKINTTASLNKPTKEVIPKYLKTLVINFQSIRNKTADLEILLECEKPDIIAETETWLHPEIYNAEIFNSNYEIFRKDRADNHGGVLLAIKNTLIAEEITLPNSKNVESTFCKINTTSTSLIIGSIYRPPNSSLEYMQELCNQITTLKETNKNAVFWIMVTELIQRSRSETVTQQEIDYVKSCFYVLNNGHIMTKTDHVKDGNTYHIVPCLLGGKGGFGFMLRAIGAQIEKTTSREACRDLSGRRMRDINNEKLKEWLAKEAERERNSQTRALGKVFNSTPQV
ncbi:protein SDE2 [Biomphalaria glabrata]